MELIEGSKTSAIRTQTPGNYPKENIFTSTSFLAWSFAKHSFPLPHCLHTCYLGIVEFRILPKKLLGVFEPITLQILIFCGLVLDNMCVLNFRNLSAPKMPKKSHRKEGALNTWDWETDYHT